MPVESARMGSITATTQIPSSAEIADTFAKIGQFAPQGYNYIAMQGKPSLVFDVTITTTTSPKRA